MKIMPATYRTAQIAAACGIHPNTVRQYEELGFIPAVPRAANGYRIFSRLHLEHVRLARTALKSTWLGGVIRNKALLVLQLAAAGKLAAAMQEAREHLALVSEERGKAEIAASLLERWAAARDNFAPWSEQCLRSRDVAVLLDVTGDMLRSWERNGLITVPRDPQNGYRIYGPKELRRLYLIRALRKGRFSLMSIHHMLGKYDRGIREGLARILDELPPEEDDIVFNTNQWLTKIRNIEDTARELINGLKLIGKLAAEQEI